MAVRLIDAQGNIFYVPDEWLGGRAGQNMVPGAALLYPQKGLRQKLPISPARKEALRKLRQKHKLGEYAPKRRR